MPFPRFSVSGIAILVAYSMALKLFFDGSHYGVALKCGLLTSSSPASLNCVVTTTSLLNVLSHAAVVFGALDDTYVLSTLLGVGFDVVTRMFRFIWFLNLTWITCHQIKGGEDRTHASTILFLLVLSISYSFHLTIHIQALQLNHSVERLAKILKGAINNLRGIPGEHYEDHIFAYTDLGSHLCPFVLSGFLANEQGALGLAAMVLLFLMIVSAFILARVPFNDARNGKDGLVRLIAGNICCFCPSCESEYKRTGKLQSFAFSSKAGVCRLWLCSFEQLSDILLHSTSQCVPSKAKAA